MDNNPYSAPNSDLIQTPSEFVVPEETAKRIRNAVIAACISGCITLLATLAAMGGSSMLGFSAWNFADVFLIFGLALGIYKNSRTCAVIMFVYFLISKAMMVQASGNVGSLLLSVIFFYFYFLGILGTFSYHKLKKEHAIQA